MDITYGLQSFDIIVNPVFDLGELLLHQKETKINKSQKHHTYIINIHTLHSCNHLKW